MSPEALAVELEREPFVPLRVYLADGRTIDVMNPGLCFIARLALYVFRPGRPHPTMAEDAHVVSLSQIVSVEAFQPSPR